MRIWAGPDQLGSWPLEDVSVERMTPSRFRILVEGDETIITPDDPTRFATATNAHVDARTSHFGLFSRTSRYGLADRTRSSRES
jgi:hypothetical protein